MGTRSGRVFYYGLHIGIQVIGLVTAMALYLVAGPLPSLGAMVGVGIAGAVGGVYAQELADRALPILGFPVDPYTARGHLTSATAMFAWGVAAWSLTFLAGPMGSYLAVAYSAGAMILATLGVVNAIKALSVKSIGDGTGI